jgi:hypothetical protein
MQRSSITLAREGFVDGSAVALALDPIALPLPTRQAGNGKLTLKKENGILKGFEYRCPCGHKDHFVCE